MINVTWLNTFCTLVEVGHFTQTAQQLFMTQSGVSQHIRKLEVQLEVTLLIREGKQFSLSDAGQRLYEQGKILLLSMANIEHDITQDDPYEGVVKVMSPGSVGLKLYPKLLALQARYPRLSIDFRFAPNNDIQQALSESKIDIGVMSFKPTVPEVRGELVASEPLLLVTPADMKSVSWQALSELGFIDHPDGAHHADLLLSANFQQFQHSDLLLKRGFSNQIGLILEPVSRGLGFTVLPAYAVEAFREQNAIKAHHLSVAVSEPIYVCTHSKKRLPSRAQTALNEALKWLNA
ncbi:LysR family transcriptional regulator [Pseudoalteromonas byunsanensis]|uniref:LysR family transcriptional regulator n=1 Tax=Pseudoalteromonas byunsanensis TaxID=327939 RepID=A0A1S1N836_9GAMM|nr:LysR family transcriptional regulator [Pseudoalteromonas byunsanensis]OHU95586.1 LysR family transcriptional regulator [Pseudoalteromonas byunsanensis]